MKVFLLLLLMLGNVLHAATESTQDAELRTQLENVYGFWRGAMIKRDYSAWAKATAAHRQMTVKNRINSERRTFPQGIFALPAAPPALTGLKLVQLKRNGATAKGVYFGKIDFSVGGAPTENLLVIDFIQEQSGWKYDIAEFVSLLALPDVRAELGKGDYSYIEKTPEFAPSGKVPQVPTAVPMAKYISKVYVFCPGRMVDVTVNRISKHQFGNAKEAELVMGGLKDGKNEVSFSVKGVPGGKGNEAMTIRVYAFSQIDGVKPVKAFEYQVAEGQQVKGSGTMTFDFDAAMAAKILGK
ncbi:MAG: hypothetical protein KGQ89_04515 [Verrucomicrobia bacterium]|nr:hypothetical protein [Verrucomicrobiota bacterium]